MTLSSQLGPSRLAVRDRAKLRKTELFQSAIVISLPSLAVLGSLAPGIGPFFAFRFAVPLLALCVLVGRQTWPSRSTVRTAAIVLCWVWLVALLALSIAAPPSSSMWAEALSVGIGLVLLASMAAGTVSAQTIRTFSYGWLIAYLLTAMIAGWELLSGSHLSNYFIYHDLSLPDWTATHAIASTLGNPNNYGFFLFASLIVLAVGRVSTPSRFARSVFSSSLVSVPVLLYFTESRTALAVCLAVLFLYFVIQRSLVTVVLTGLAAATALIWGSYVGSTHILRAITEGVSELTAGNSGTVRLNLTLNGFDFLFETYLLGLGPGGFQSRLAQGGRFPTLGVLSPHNGAIEVLAQYGVIVFAVLVILLTLLITTGWRAFIASPRGSEQRYIGGALVLAVLTLPPIVVTNSSTLTQSFPWVYLAFLVIVGIYVNQATPGGGKQPPSAFGHRLDGLMVVYP